MRRFNSASLGLEVRGQKLEVRAEDHMRLPCPVCGKSVRIVDPYANAVVKRASAWFANHKDENGKKCLGSQATAIQRDPMPASQQLSRY